jgi:hypothetical protein
MYLYKFVFFLVRVNVPTGLPDVPAGLADVPVKTIKNAHIDTHHDQ